MTIEQARKICENGYEMNAVERALDFRLREIELRLPPTDRDRFEDLLGEKLYQAFRTGIDIRELTERVMDNIEACEEQFMRESL